MFIAFAIIDIGYAVPLDVKNLTFALVLSQAVELKNNNICIISESFIINFFFPESLIKIFFARDR